MSSAWGTLSSILGNKGVQAGLLGGGAILGGYLGSRPTASQTAATTASMNALNQLSGIAGQQAQITLPALSQASQYYSTLLGLPGGGVGGAYSAGGSNPLGLTYLNSGIVPKANSPSTLGSMGSGALTGASIGSLAGPIGALAGAAGGAEVGLLKGMFHGAGGPPALAAHDSQIANAMTGDAKKILDAVNAGTLTPQDAYNHLQGLWDWASGNFQQSHWTQTQKPYMDAWMKSMTDLGATPGGAPSGTPGSTPQSLMPGVPAPGGYSSLGQMNAVQNLLSMPIQQTTAQFNQARQNIMASMPPGGARDKALAYLDQSRTSTLSNLFMGAQAKGAEGLLGVGQAANPAQTLGTLLSGANALQTQGTIQQLSGQQQGQQIGSTLAQILFGQGGILTGGGGGSKGTSTSIDPNVLNQVLNFPVGATKTPGGF